MGRLGISSAKSQEIIVTSGIIVTRATSNLPQSAAVPIFNVIGGPVIVRQIVGEVTTVLGGSLNNAKLTANPTVGSLQDLCAILNVGNDVIGTRYNLTGTFTDSMVKSSVGALQAQGSALLVIEGTIDLDCSASLVGQVAWTIVYDTLGNGSIVAA